VNTRNTSYRVLVIHGPNLNLLGTREPEIYGHTTLNDIDTKLTLLGKEWGIAVESFQSNHEGLIVDTIQTAREVNGVIINPAAYTHTSIAIRDALLAIDAPVIEVHLSNIHRRETFRHHSMMADVVEGQIIGLGVNGYYLALRALADMLGVSAVQG